MARRKKLNKQMTQAGFNQLLDARLEKLYPELAAVNRLPTVYHGAYAERVNSTRESYCPLCKRTLPIIDFSARNKCISGICWDCQYESAIKKIMFNPTKHNYSPLRTLVRNETSLLKKNGYIKLELCFCGKPATKFHHPNYSRPNIGNGYCKTHHELLHTIITELEVELEFFPRHHKYRYYKLITNADGTTTYVLKPEFQDEIGNSEKPLSYREIKGRDRKQSFIDNREREEELHIIANVIRKYGKNYTKKNLADYKAKLLLEKEAATGGDTE
jgi:hypothetical protein